MRDVHTFIDETPKILLHDHLDGGVRPQTLIELAEEMSYTHLPSNDADKLQQYFDTQAAAGSLEQYLRCFDHIQPLLQTTSALHRVAVECADDYTADNITYAEVRFAPQAHTLNGLMMDDAVEAVLDGLARAPIRVRLILTALRHLPASRAVAELALRWAGAGVVGFDLAGPERGHPCRQHADALGLLRGHLPITIHAGEGDGPLSIAEAIDHGASRIGHGVRLLESLDTAWTGPDLIETIRQRNITLEICPTSNMLTGIVQQLNDHPFQRLRDLGVPVTVNTDNRTFGVHTLTDEMHRCAQAFGWGQTDVTELAANAARSAFDPPETCR